MKNVRLPQGASVQMSRDAYAKASGGGGVGWWIAGGVFLVIAFGSTNAPDHADNNHKTTPTHSAPAKP